MGSNNNSLNKATPAKPDYALKMREKIPKSIFLKCVSGIKKNYFYKIAICVPLYIICNTEELFSRMIIKFQSNKLHRKFVNIYFFN